jgi:UDP-N-acetylglucosamine 2-epimerase (non-hydrolysing)
MKKLKIITIVGTRPEIIRLSRIISKFENSIFINHILIHTGQNYDFELNKIFFNDLELPSPDYYLSSAGSNATETIGNILIKIDPILESENPDCVFVLGDTNSCLSVLAAKKRRIPIFHLEAGNRCFDQRVPEEVNRKIVDVLSDINLTYSDIAREYLINEGFAPDRIIKVGSPMFEVINHYFPRVSSSSILKKLGLEKGGYFLISIHREENVMNETRFLEFINSLNAIARIYALPIIVSTHPRTRIILERIKPEVNELIRFEKPFGYIDYLSLQSNSKVVLSDSGTISEESSILNFCALNIRDSHERPEAMRKGKVIMTGLKSERILQGLEYLETEDPKVRKLAVIEDYNIPNVSEAVVKIILSYIDYIKRVVWRE